jgi:hypothetical protein
VGGCEGWGRGWRLGSGRGEGLRGVECAVFDGICRGFETGVGFGFGAHDFGVDVDVEVVVWVVVMVVVMVVMAVVIVVAMG